MVVGAEVAIMVVVALGPLVEEVDQVILRFNM
jgi:hypothetical protein